MIRKGPRRCCCCEAVASGSKIKIDGHQRAFCPACWGKLSAILKQSPSPNMEGNNEENYLKNRFS